MQMRIREITDRLKRSTLFRDSLWAVCGNGFGNALLLFAGIWIARLLGKDLYGEYGVVKTNMFYMAGLSTFGLVYSSTRYIATYLASDKTRIPGVIRNATRITFAFSTLIAIALSLAAPRIETFLETPGIAPVFRMLSVIIVFKALASTGNGILAGLGKFSLIAKSNVVSGALMFALCVPLTYFAGLYGALFSLAVSQLVNAAVNYWYICGESRRLPIYCYCEDSVGSLLRFSFPIALQEISYALCNWCGILMLTKLSSLSEVGLYSASVQWNAVICLIPGLLANVVLSHLSKTDGAQQQRLVSRLLAVYLYGRAVRAGISVCGCHHLLLRGRFHRYEAGAAYIHPRHDSDLLLRCVQGRTDRCRPTLDPVLAADGEGPHTGIAGLLLPACARRSVGRLLLYGEQPAERYAVLHRNGGCLPFRRKTI